MPKPKVRNFIAQCTLIDSCLYSGSTTAQLQVLQFAVLPVTKLILQDRGHSSFDLVSYSPLKEDQNVGGTSCSVLILSSHKLPIHHMNLLQLFRNSKDMIHVIFSASIRHLSESLAFLKKKKIGLYFFFSVIFRN